MVYTTNNPTYKNDGLGAGLLLLFHPHSGNPVQMDVNLGIPSILGNLHLLIHLEKRTGWMVDEFFVDMFFFRVFECFWYLGGAPVTSWY